jgi:hypothetical protein
LAERQARLPRLSVSESLWQFFELCDQIRPWRPDPPTEPAFFAQAHSGWIALYSRLP